MSLDILKDVKLTAQIKLLPDKSQAEALLSTLRAANDACNFVSRAAWKEKNFRQFDLHRLCYKDVRSKFNLSAQLAVRVLSKVADGPEDRTQMTYDRIFFTFGGGMLGFLLRWSINLLALITAAVLIKGIRIQSIEMGILAAGFLGIVNAVIRPVVLVLTLPINLLTLGLFTLVINAAMLKLVATVVPGLVIEGFWAAFWGAFVISVVSWLLNLFVGGDGKMMYIRKVKR